MRNPGLRLVGIRSSHGGRGGGSFVTTGDIGEIGVFGNNRAEEELRLWLESRLDALGIDPVAYSRFVLSLLRHPDSALSPINPHETTATFGRRNRARARSKIPNQGDRDQKRAVVQCLINAADQKCGVEPLVDELCAKLRDLEGGGTSEDSQNEAQKFEVGKSVVHQPQKRQHLVKNSFETLTPRDRALRYYAAFPALQPATPKKNSNHKKEKNLGTNSGSFNNNNHNINNNNNNNNNKNRNTTGVNGNNNNKNNNKTGMNSGNSTSNKGRQKKSRMPPQRTIEDLCRADEESSFAFVRATQFERAQELETDLDQMRLAELEAKFDETLQALWDNTPENRQDRTSIWADPSLSIPSIPLWPTSTGGLPLNLPLNNSSVSSATTPYSESVVDNSPAIPWDMVFRINDVSHELIQQIDMDDSVDSSQYIADGGFSWMDFAEAYVPTSDAVTTTPAVNESDDEDLLTSTRTHFCPIRDAGNWADGTTFPINNDFERVAYRRSESGNLLYLPGGESPYMEYREEAAAAAATNAATTTGSQSAFTLKFRVKQCDKGTQTDPIRSPIKRRYTAEGDDRCVSEDQAEDVISREVDKTEDEDSLGLSRLSNLGYRKSDLITEDTVAALSVGLWQLCAR